MRREGRVAGKPTNHSRVTGKCKVVGCSGCHDSLPLNKSRGKGKGRIKRLVSDIPSTHQVSDWRVSKPSSLGVRCNGSRQIARPFLKWDATTDWASDDYDDVEGNDRDDCVEDPKGWALSISLLIDTALEHIQEDAKSGSKKADTAIFDGQEAHDALKALFTGDSDGDISDGEVPNFESFKDEFEVFKTEIDAVCSTASVAESACSWSGIELSDADESCQSDWEDDWSLVGREIAV